MHYRLAAADDCGLSRHWSCSGSGAGVMIRACQWQQYNEVTMWACSPAPGQAPGGSLPVPLPSPTLPFPPHLALALAFAHAHAHAHAPPPSLNLALPFTLPFSLRLSPSPSPSPSPISVSAFISTILLLLPVPSPFTLFYRSRPLPSPNIASLSLRKRSYFHDPSSTPPSAFFLSLFRSLYHSRILSIALAFEGGFSRTRSPFLSPLMPFSPLPLPPSVPSLRLRPSVTSLSLSLSRLNLHLLALALVAAH